MATQDIVIERLQDFGESNGEAIVSDENYQMMSADLIFAAPKATTHLSKLIDVVTLSTNHAIICPKVPNTQKWWLGL